MPSHVNFITGNAHKLGEVKAFLEPAIEVRSQPIDLEEIQGTLEEVTTSKCRKAAETVSAKNRPYHASYAHHPVANGIR